MAKLTTEDFIIKAKIIHGNKFDYSLVNYENTLTKVDIICPILGIFKETPKRHLTGVLPRDIRRENEVSFLKKSREKHGEKYNYDLVNYIDNKKNVTIICPIHDKFEQTPSIHLRGKGCKQCFFDSRKTIIENFINRAKLIHNKLYDYSKINYINNFSKIDIICSIHGVFQQTPANHLSGHKCVYCMGLNKKTTQKFIEESKLIHGDKFNYSKVDYKKSKSNVIIICYEHGDFNQSAISHLRGSICPECSNNTNRKTTQEFIYQAKIVHGDKYDYSHINYINSYTKVKVVCNKHGEFEQNPNTHLTGKGCSICKESKGERKIRLYLIANKIEFETQKTYPECKLKNLLKFDVYIPHINTCIEFNGRQHYESVSIFGGDKGLNLVKKRDKIKMEYCLNNNIPLIIIDDVKDVEGVLNNLFNIIPIISNSNC